MITIKKKIIITAAVTGAIHTPTMSPYLPKTPQEIIDAAVGAYEAGASMVHVHARKDETGEPTSDLNIMRQIVTGIKKRCNVVIGITTGGALGMTFEERLASIPELKPEVASCNGGSMNFVLSPMAEKMEEALYPWEKPFLERTYENIFPNTFRDLERCILTMNANGTKPEFEVFDLGQVNTIAYFVKKGIVKPPVFIQFVFGVLGGMPASVENLLYLYKTAKELVGDFEFSIVAPGKWAFILEPVSAALGGNVRVGLEDSLFIAPRVLAKSNAEQVTNIRGIVERMGFSPATPDEAREILKLKGADKVNF